MAAAAGDGKMSGLLPPDKTGWLEKRGGFRKNWARRWFVLKDNELKYYKSEKVTPTTKEQGSINLDGCAVEIAPEPKYSRKFCFELNSPHQNRVFVIIAENGTSLQDWMNAIRRAMLRIRREKTKAESAIRKGKNGGQDVDGEGGVSARVDKDAAAAAAALAAAPPPPSATSAANFGAPVAGSSADTLAKQASRSHANSLSVGAPPPATVHRHSTASKNEASRPVDAPPPVATNATRFAGAAVSKQDDNHKFDVYLQWLEEQNKDKDAANGGANTAGRGSRSNGSGAVHGHHTLLTDDSDGRRSDGGGGGCCEDVREKCTIM